MELKLRQRGGNQGQDFVSQGSPSRDQSSLAPLAWEGADLAVTVSWDQGMRWLLGPVMGPGS